MKNGARWLAALVVLFGATTLRGQDLIIETQKEGQNSDHYEELEGKWMDSKMPPATAKSRAPGCTDGNKCGTRKYLFSAGTPDAPDDKGNPEPAAARFYPRFSTPGHYYVYATWPRAANATPVKYIVKHAKGTDTKELTQDGWGDGGTGISNANTWVLIGDYDFNAGDDQYVELRVDKDVRPVSPKNYGQVYADAIRFSSKPLENPGQAALATVTPSAGGAAPQPQATPTVVGQLKWFENIQDAQRAAAGTNKRILLFFYAPTSERSQLLEKNLASPEVAAILQNSYVLTRLNFLENTKVAYSLGVFKAGVINVYDSQGNALFQINERLTPSELAEKLKVQ
ncbi:MAG: hypothetical protein ACP5QZ_03970 [Candidatus Sumerlaeaceae bacterium]